MKIIMDILIVCICICGCTAVQETPELCTDFDLVLLDDSIVDHGHAVPAAAIESLGDEFQIIVTASLDAPEGVLVDAVSGPVAVPAGQLVAIAHVEAYDPPAREYTTSGEVLLDGQTEPIRWYADILADNDELIVYRSYCGIPVSSAWP